MVYVPSLNFKRHFARFVCQCWSFMHCYAVCCKFTVSPNLLVILYRIILLICCFDTMLLIRIYLNMASPMITLLANRSFLSLLQIETLNLQSSSLTSVHCIQYGCCLCSHFVCEFANCYTELKCAVLIC